MAFIIQGDGVNEWWFPTTEQWKTIHPLYKKWKQGLGQGNMAAPGTEIKEKKKIGQWTYQINIAGGQSFMQNISHIDQCKRIIYFLPEHDGPIRKTS